MQLSPSIQMECMDEIFDTTKLAHEVFTSFISQCNGIRPDIQSINELFRIIHTLKALTKWMNFENPTIFFSYIEDVLYRIRENTLEQCEELKLWLLEAQKNFEIFYELIKAEANPEELNRFSFTLKRYANKDGIDNIQSLQSMRVLYVEDDQAIQAPLAKFLSRRVKELVLASDGEEGIAQFHLHRPDIVITDINMPKMHGFKMAAEIRKIDADVPIIATSAHNEKAFLHQANLYNINSYLVKPFDFEDLEMELVYCQI